ncbi:hypothetical protein V8J88_18575 [Massilia sp. W12]|uniref:hypothetical protein n=1 Tax=Massilia sp. W12 TaxID=3126507 RepID=UPI0030D00425
MSVCLSESVNECGAHSDASAASALSPAARAWADEYPEFVAAYNAEVAASLPLEQWRQF